MSWPDDGLPRFVIASVTGYPISPRHGGTSTRKFVPTSFQVLDRAYAHKVVREFLAGQHKGMFRLEQRRAAAEALAAALNRSETDGLLDEPVAVALPIGAWRR